MTGSDKGQDHDDRTAAPRRFDWRVFLLLSLGIVIALAGMLVYRIATDAPPAPPNHDRQVDPGEPAVDVQAIRQEAWRRIEPRLEHADAETRKLTDQLVHQIESFFNERSDGVRAFSEAALGWNSKLKLFTSREGHREFIAERFSEYIFTQDELAALLETASAEYAQGLKAVENSLLVQVRADLEDLPADALPAFGNEQVLASRFDRIVATVSADVARDLKVDVGREITSLAVGEIVAVVVTKTLTALTTRLGISGGILGAGVASSWATIGAGLVIAIIADSLLDWFLGWIYDPVGSIADKVTASLDEVKTTITMGDPQAWKVRDRIAEMAAGHADPELRARAAEVLASIESDGALGLKHALGQVADVQNESRQVALRQLVFEENQ